MASRKSQKRAKPLTAKTMVYSSPELKRLASDRATQEGIALSELIVRALAFSLGRPDLATVPRKSFGRPRKVPA